MKSITIHNIDEQLAKLIKSIAKANNTSVNKTIQHLLEKSLGMKPHDKDSNHGKDFIEFCGIWSEADLSEFENATNDLREIHPEDWN